MKFTVLLLLWAGACVLRLLQALPARTAAWGLLAALSAIVALGLYRKMKDHAFTRDFETRTFPPGPGDDGWTQCNATLASPIAGARALRCGCEAGHSDEHYAELRAVNW